MKKIIYLLMFIALIACEKDYSGCYECKTYLQDKEVSSFRITNPDADFIRRTEISVIRPEGTYVTKCKEI